MPKDERPRGAKSSRAFCSTFSLIDGGGQTIQANGALERNHK